jgi:hypothetical protein
MSIVVTRYPVRPAARLLAHHPGTHHRKALT